jgi:hypothetical protein
MFTLMHGELKSERPHIEKIISSVLSQISSIFGLPLQSRSLSSPQLEIAAEGIAINLSKFKVELEDVFQRNSEKVPHLWSAWNRDKPLLNVASSARKKRTEQAFSKL